MAKWSQEQVEREINGRGWYKEQKQISNGIQYRLADDTPVNFYSSTGTVLVQGKDTELKREAEELFKGEPSDFGSSEAPTKDVEVVPKETVSDKNLDSTIPKRVFIVYGRDVAAREQLELLLRRLRLEPIVLQNLTGGGDTIIENLDSLTNADFACVLLTPDDEGHLKGSDTELRARARQNTVLEMGMVLAKLGRRRVAILVREDTDHPIERPTDIEGIMYIPFWDHVNDGVITLAGRLQEAGFDIRVTDLGG